MTEKQAPKRIPVAGPSIGEREVELVSEAARTAWYDGANVFQQRFESEFSARIGTRHAIALPSCTSAIHLALAAVGVGPGDEVIVPDVTWIATAAPVCYLGATPVFADIEPDTWCLSAASVESLITPRTRAIIGVDLYGSMCDWPALRALAARHGLGLVEDAAEAIGSSLQGKPAGSHADVGTFSFHGSKTLTTGEGGMFVTDREDLRDRALKLRDHGRRPGDVSFFNDEVGFKYRMNAVTAALGIAQLERLDELVAMKRSLFEQYTRHLRDVPGVALNVEPEGVVNSYWMSTVVLDPSLGLDKQTLGQLLAERGVDSRPFFHPLSSLPAFEHSPEAAAARTRNHVAYRISPYGVNLPSALSLGHGDVAAVCAALLDIVSSARGHAGRPKGAAAR